jgi:hypothetical protein
LTLALNLKRASEAYRLVEARDEIALLGLSRIRFEGLAARARELASEILAVNGSAAASPSSSSA